MCTRKKRGQQTNMDNLSLGVNSTVATNNLAIQCMNSDSLPSKVLKITAYSIIMTVSILGNTALALVYFKGRNMKNTINLCVMNMVFSDVLVTLIYMPRVMTAFLSVTIGLSAEQLASFFANSFLYHKRFQSVCPF